MSAARIDETERDVALADKVAALRDPSCYPEPTQSVRAIETHMSWVFLTDAHAYKLKKPVRFDRQDFRTAQRRRFYCEEELRLNRRLAAPVYLDVVPLALTTDGHLRAGGQGPAVDWLVRMRRLPAESMLDALLARAAATPAQLRAVAARLAAFHLAQPAAPLDGPGYRRLLLRHIAEYESELCEPAWGLPAARIAELCARQRSLLAASATAFDQRVVAGRVVEGHGDLRPEHVYLGQPLAIIDCLEFSRELRLLDGADEIGFLALECEAARAAPLAAVLLQAYGEASGEPLPEALVHFYQSCRACGRARLAIRHLREARYRSSPAWRRRALRYLALAERHLRACQATPAPAVR
jgi:uncharacterized protein